ncbi:MAG: hypothetical protein WDZ35_05355 [Crocinitomicaceae bacterium]
MRLAKFYREGELSSIRMSNEVEAVNEVKGLFFIEQLIEEGILLELKGSNKNRLSTADEVRLDFDLIYSKKELLKKAHFSGKKLVDSAKVNTEFSIETILSIKNEQRHVSAIFRNFVVLQPRFACFNRSKEPMLFASLRNDNYYLLNPEMSQNNRSLLTSFKNWIKNKISFKTSSRS